MTPRSVFLSLVAVLRYVVSILAYAAAATFVVILALEFLHAPKIAASPIVVRAEHLVNPSIAMVSRWFGWTWPAGATKNYAPLILAVVALFLRAVIDGALLRIDFSIRRLFKKPVQLRYKADDAHPGYTAHVKLSAESEEQRAVLLKRYREIEDALKTATKKSCTFLSIDVVGSTKMKVGERKTAIEATFQAYEEMVRQTFEAYGVWKETWTPDGVMACFLDRDLAVSAAQQILTALPEFNHGQNQLRTPIAVRCGINEGDVAIFEDSKLEKVADHAIDVAGHMQKYADEDELQVSDLFYEKLQNRDGFAQSSKEVDGFRTYVWKATVGAAAVPLT